MQQKPFPPEVIVPELSSIKTVALKIRSKSVRVTQNFVSMKEKDVLSAGEVVEQKVCRTRLLSLK